MIVVTTPTGTIGASVLSQLIDAGAEVRVIVRDQSNLPTAVRGRVDVVEGSHRDPAVMSEALHGGDALFLLVPPGFEPAGARVRYLDFANAAIAAVRENAVPRVVGVTSAGHDWARPAGLLSAAFAMDAAINESGVAYRALSMPWFMDNLLGQVGSMRHTGRISMGYAADRILPSIASRDIAEVAAAMLLDRTWTGQERVPVFGPDRLKPVEMTEVVSRATGRSIEYDELPLETIAAGLARRGASSVTTNDVVEMIEAQNAGLYDVDLAASSPTPTRFEDWVETVFLPLYQADATD